METQTTQGFIIGSKVMMRAFSAMTKAIPAKTLVPALECVKVDVSDGAMTLTSGDLDIMIVKRLEAEGECSVLIPAKEFHDLLSKLPEAPIEVMPTISRNEALRIDDYGVDVRCGGGEYSLPSDDSLYYPMLQMEEEDDVRFFMDAGALLEGLHYCESFCSTNDFDPPWSHGILLTLDGGSISFMATNGHTGCHFSAPLKSAVAQVSVSSKVVRIVSESIASDASIEVTITDKKIRFGTEDVEIISTLLVAPSPKYDPLKLFEQNNSTIATINAADLKPALQRTAIFTNVKSRELVLGFSADEKLTITGREYDVSRSSVEVLPLEDFEGDEVEVAMSCSLLLSTIAKLSGTLRLCCAGPMKAMMILPEDERLALLILPMRKSI